MSDTEIYGPQPIAAWHTHPDGSTIRYGQGGFRLTHQQWEAAMEAAEEFER